MPDIMSRLASKLLPEDTQERCGFVTKRGRVIEVKNVHPVPEKGFKIDPKETLKALKSGVVGTWHTHPKSDPNLSGEDYVCFCAWDTLVHYIVGRRNKKVVVTKFRVNDGILVQE